MIESTLRPFTKGDVFVGVTELNNSADDHAGRGRIIQYDAGLNHKGVLWLEATTHLVGGLKFDSQGVLWAFDSQEFVVLNIFPNGRVAVRDLPKRSFSHVNFLPDGSFLLGEHVVGSEIKPEIAACLQTRIPHMPGTTRFGDGHVWHFRADGALLREYATQTHGGMGGFLGVTMATVSPDARTLVYTSETGPRLMRYDLVRDRQLPDLQSFQPPFQGPPEMFFSMQYAPDGTLYVLRGARIDVVNESGQTARSIPLQGFGWATMDITVDSKHAFVGSFFSGELAKIDLQSGEKTASVQTGQTKALAGIAEFQGVRAAAPATAPLPKASAPKPRAVRKAKRVVRRKNAAKRAKTATRAKVATRRKVSKRGAKPGRPARVRRAAAKSKRAGTKPRRKSVKARSKK